MTRPVDSEIWQGFERRLGAVERLLPERPPRWIGPAEDGSEAHLRVVTAGRPGLRARHAGDRGLLLIAAAVVVAIGGIRLAAAPATEPGSQPTTSASAPTPSIPAPTASASPSPVATFRSIGIAFKEVPAWLVPADGSVGASAFSEDGTWSQHYDIPRSPTDVVDDYRTRLTSKGIDVQSTTSGTRVVLNTRGVAPAIVVIVSAKGNGSGVDLSFDRRGS